MAFRFRSTLTLLAMGVWLFAGCSFGKLKSGPGNSSSSAPTEASSDSSVRTASFSPSSDARKDVADALRRLNSAYPYRLTEVATGSANGQTGPESTRVVEFAAANRSHMKWTGGPGGDIEAISIGDKHYWFSGGKWTEGRIPAMLGSRGEDFAQKLADMVKEVKYVGPETVNGTPCFAYFGTFETLMGGQKWTGTSKLWIGAVDGLIRQGDTDFSMGDYRGKSRTVYEYNVKLKIEPPAM